jgi:hypothetical protein
MGNGAMRHVPEAAVMQQPTAYAPICIGRLNFCDLTLTESSIWADSRRGEGSSDKFDKSLRQSKTLLLCRYPTVSRVRRCTPQNRDRSALQVPVVPTDPKYTLRGYQAFGVPRQLTNWFNFSSFPSYLNRSFAFPFVLISVHLAVRMVASVKAYILVDASFSLYVELPPSKKKNKRAAGGAAVLRMSNAAILPVMVFASI